LVILSHLGGELPSGYLAARFSHSWPTTTRHLAVLENAGLVVVRREGRSAFYRLDRPRIERVLGTWLAHLTPPAPDKKWKPRGARSTDALRKTPPDKQNDKQEKHR
jgi:DNA-binding transcriptional ArsR family regulator